MSRFLRVCSLFLAILTLCLLPSLALTAEGEDAVAAVAFPVAAGAAPTVGAASAALYDVVGERFLTLKQADVRRPMASTTKIMTALVAIEQLSPDEVVTVPREAVGVEGSSVYLFEGEQITVRTLLYALLLSSANDAAVALAHHTAGSQEAFAALMNERAASLGLTDTHFTNPHGLPDEEHYTTARELALITVAALKNPLFAEIVATGRYEAPQEGTGAVRLFLNHNRLLRTLPGAVGVKTGFTKKSGRCLVSAATREGLTLVAVTLNDGNDWQDHKTLLEWGFSAYRAVTLTAEPVPVPVVGGTEPSTALLPAISLTLSLPRDGRELSLTVEAPRFLFAGLAKGTRVGRLVYSLDGRVVATVPLVTEAALEQDTRRLSLWERLKRLFIK